MIQVARDKRNNGGRHERIKDTRQKKHDTKETFKRNKDTITKDR